MDCDPNILDVPDWIDWDCVNYPLSDLTGGDHKSYRKITNLYGGSHGGDLKWLSEFRTSGAPAGHSINSTKYARVPKYLWGLDTKYKKLRISKNNEETLKKDLSKTCPSNETCCTENSTESQCVYQWYGKEGGGAYAGYCDKDNSNYFIGPKSSSDVKWSYFYDDCRKVCRDGCYEDKCDENGERGCRSICNVRCEDDEECKNTCYDECHEKCIYNCADDCDEDCEGDTDKLFGGTFCYNANFDGGFFPDERKNVKKYIGCDCKRNNQSGEYECTNMSTTDCSDKNRGYFLGGPEWQFIDEAAAVACCSLPSEEVGDYPQCKYDFDPTKDSNKCIVLMQDFCKDNWGSTNNIGQGTVGDVNGNKCNQFLLDSEANVKTIQETIQNYITHPTRVPQDYVSRDLYKVGHGPSVKYYDNPYCKTVSGIAKRSSEDGEAVTINIPDLSEEDFEPVESLCDRNDSTDPFFKNVMPYLCSFGANNVVHEDANPEDMVGVCDAQLNYFCAQFTREELSADTTLLNLCGCHLIGTNQNKNPANPSIGGKKMELRGTAQTVSPYYVLPDGDNCDVLCTNSNIQNKAGKCDTPTCIIDSVAINVFESGVGDNISVVQDCDGGGCYIGTAEINVINSNVGGSEYIEQKCGTCWRYEGDDISGAEKVDCNTFEPSDLTKKEEEIKDKIKDKFGVKDEGSWTKYIIYIVIFFVVMCILGFAAFFFFKKK